MPGTSIETSLTRRAFFGGGDKQNAVHLKIASTCLAMSGVSCRSCEDHCVERAIRFRPKPGGNYVPELNENICTACLECQPACPVGAIESVERTAHAQQS